MPGPTLTFILAEAFFSSSRMRWTFVGPCKVDLIGSFLGIRPSQPDVADATLLDASDFESRPTIPTHTQMSQERDCCA